MVMLFVLVLGGATLWGILNVTRKYFLDNRGRQIDPWTMIIGTTLTSSVIAFGWQFIYYGVPKISDGFWTPFIIGAALSIIIQSANVLAITDKEDVSLVAAVQGLTPILVLFTSWVLLKEFPTPMGLAGILLIVAGLLLFSWQKRGKEEMPESRNIISSFFKLWLRLFSSRGVRIAFLSAVAGAFALSYGKLTVLASSPSTKVGATRLVITLVIFLMAKKTGRWKGISQGFYIACIIGLFAGVMEVMFSSAYLFGIVPYVGALKRFQIIVTTILAIIFLGEKYSKAKIAAAILMFAGIVFTAF